MTVAELIKDLQRIPNQDALVVLARDEEGNGFRVYDGCSTEHYNRIWGEVIHPDDLKGRTDTEEAVVLW